MDTEGKTGRPEVPHCQTCVNVARILAVLKTVDCEWSHEHAVDQARNDSHIMFTTNKIRYSMKENVYSSLKS